MSEQKHSYCDKDITNLPLIGQGGQGKVYLLPDHKVIKVFDHRSCCADQLFTLQAAAHSRFFPKVHEYDEYSIIIDYIEGIQLDKYLKNRPLSKKLAFELVALIREFESLKFKKLDVRLPHIFVQLDESIKVIDPRKSFKDIQPFPYNMLNGLRNRGSLTAFFEFIKPNHPEIYDKWRKMWDGWEV